ncbi:MAG: hypothetical protein HOO93_06805 [Methyloglobulus sp.]|nr:hypothetical protein [Methyloglobulus sp.]
MTLTKAVFAQLLYHNVGLSQLEAKNLVDQFLDEIKDTLERHEPVKLPGFGKFIESIYPKIDNAFSWYAMNTWGCVR